MTMLYEVFPPATAWAMLCKHGEGSDQKAATKARPTLICVGLLAGVIRVQIWLVLAGVIQICQSCIP